MGMVLELSTLQIRKDIIESLKFSYGIFVEKFMLVETIVTYIDPKTITS